MNLQEKLEHRADKQDIKIKQLEASLNKNQDQLKVVAWTAAAVISVVGIYALVSRGKVKTLALSIKKQSKAIELVVTQSEKIEGLILDEARRGDHDPELAARLFEKMVKKAATKAANVEARDAAQQMITDSVTEIASDAAATIASSIAHKVGATAGRGAALEYSLGLH